MESTHRPRNPSAWQLPRRLMSVIAAGLQSYSILAFACAWGWAFYDGPLPDWDIQGNHGPWAQSPEGALLLSAVMATVVAFPLAVLSSIGSRSLKPTGLVTLIIMWLFILVPHMQLAD